MRNISLCLAAGWVALSASALARAGDKNTVACTGKVVDGKGRPVVGGTVEVYTVATSIRGRGVWLRRLAKGATGEDGRFSLGVRKAPVRGVVIIARKKGAGLDWMRWAGRVQSDFTLTLSGEAALAGTVVDKGGKPVVGAEVRPMLVQPGRPKEGMLWCLSAMDALVARTDAQGRFRLTGVPRSKMAELAVVVRGEVKATTAQWWGGALSGSIAPGRRTFGSSCPAWARSRAW